MEFNFIDQLFTSIMRKLDRTAQKLVEKRREAGGNSKKVREAEEEVREAGDVYPLSPPPL